jgi:hypothetical protein
MNPKVFVSHASEDKERFVIGFAQKLRARGIDAWLDRWEMYPGDSLVGKIFEEGIKNAQAIVVVVSAHSVNKPWVKEELNAGVVKRINEGSLLIPVVIDDCEVPEALKATLWSRIVVLGNYEEEFERIVSAIFNRRERPPLGSPPKYTQVAVDSIPGLTEVDSLVLIRACEQWLDNKARGIQTAELLDKVTDLQIPQVEFLESVEILARKGYIEATRVMGGAIPFFRITHFGFDQYLRRVVSGYDAIYDQVCLAILNENLAQNVQITQRLNQPISIIDHVMEDLNNRGLVRAVKFIGGGQCIFSVSPELQRLYRNK